MIDWVIGHQALIREFINGFCMVLFLVLSLVVLVFMWDTWTDSKSMREWREAPGMPTACALWWVFAAECYRTGVVWVLYNLGKREHVTPFPASDGGVGVFGAAGFWSTFGYLIAGFMLAGGLLRSIYIFTPPEWKRRVWLYAMAGATVFVSIPSIVNLIKDYINGI